MNGLFLVGVILDLAGKTKEASLGVSRVEEVIIP
jgi:hypothetical protein